MTQVIKDVVTWLKQWFYTESEVDTLLGGKVSTAQGSSNASKNVVTDSGGNITLEAKPTIPSASSTTPSADTTSGAVGTGTTWARADHKHPKSSIYAEATHTHTKSNITDFSHTHSISDVTSLQSELDDLDDRIDDLESIKAIEVVVSLPTASADTMGRLYIISENSKINVYYTVTDGQSYEWHKMDADILDELSIAWNDITGKPTFSTVATSGSYNDLSNKPTIPDVSGKIDTAGTGLSKSGTTLNHSNSITAQTSAVFKKIKYDAQGHITGTANVTDLDLPHHTHNEGELTDSNAHSNIGTSAYASQGAINTAIDTAIGGKSDKTATIGTTITLVDKGETNEGCIIFNTIS